MEFCLHQNLDFHQVAAPASAQLAEEIGEEDALYEKGGWSNLDQNLVSKRVLSPNVNVFDDFSCFFVPVGNEDRASSVGEDDAVGKFGDMLAVAQVRKNFAFLPKNLQK